MAKTLYVGNLPWSVTDEELAEVFSEYTEVISARVIVDRNTGRSRGFGFVEVPDDKVQSLIDALDGAEWQGRQIKVNESEPRRQRRTDRAGYGTHRF